MNRFPEEDWKLFRSKISDWQEAYMKKLNEEYIEILSGDGYPLDKFRVSEKRLDMPEEEIRDYHSRSGGKVCTVVWM